MVKGNANLDGKVFVNNEGGYHIHSCIAKAAVHSGLIGQDERGLLKMTFRFCKCGFEGSRDKVNGVVTSDKPYNATYPCCFWISKPTLNVEQEKTRQKLLSNNDRLVELETKLSSLAGRREAAESSVL